MYIVWRKFYNCRKVIKQFSNIILGNVDIKMIDVRNEFDMIQKGMNMFDFIMMMKEKECLQIFEKWSGIQE